MDMCITLEGERYLPDQKFNFSIEASDGESTTSGKIVLTYEQALAVAYASNEEMDRQSRLWI